MKFNIEVNKLIIKSNYVVVMMQTDQQCNFKTIAYKETLMPLRAVCFDESLLADQLI